ncbi:MAG: hypothetical protein IJR45_02495 [Firmicutes bacterium]|nr:hypothetical protein [Bacillota bacterium]
MIELIISAALITIVGAGFCTASAGAHITNVKNAQAIKAREAVVSYIDQQALRNQNSSDWVNRTEDYFNTNYISAPSKSTYVGWATVQITVDGATDADSAINCAICKPLDKSYGGTNEMMYFGFETPYQAPPSGP